MASTSEHRAKATLRRAMRARLSHTLMAALLVLQAGCVSFSDGPYRQVEGREVEADDYAALTEGTTTLAEALALFGPPDSRQATPQGLDQLVWHSSRKRESVQRIFGIVVDRHAAWRRSVLLLEFRDERLVRKDLADASPVAAENAAAHCSDSSCCR